ncbi:YgaP family membrane protein [Myxosarcina sp. GI1(2024)]
MKKNIGAVDKVIRLASAITISIILLKGVVTGWLGLLLGIIAVILLLTGLVSTCPLYLPFCITTRKK